MIQIDKEKLNNPVYLRAIGLRVLEESLGCVGAAMFLQQYEMGSGDYTNEREELLQDITMDDIKKELNK